MYLKPFACLYNSCEAYMLRVRAKPLLLMIMVIKQEMICERSADVFK
jgi:hypothetical protein